MTKEEILKYPCEPPKGIMHFPQGVMCLTKEEDTGKEEVKIKRISGDEFEFEITSKKLSKEEQYDFPIRICEYEKIDKKEAEKLSEDDILKKIKAKPMVKSEKKVDLTKGNKHKVIVKDGELLKIGNTITYTAGTNLITLDDSAGAGDSWGTAYDMDDVLSACGAVVTKQGADAFDVSARMQFNDGVYFVSESQFVEVKPNPINPAWTWRQQTGSHIRIGYYDATDKFCCKGSFWKIYVNSTTTAGGNYYRGETLIYGSTMWNDANNYTDAISFEPFGTTKVYDSVMSGKAYMRTTDIDFRNVRWINNDDVSFALMVASGFDYAWSGITTIKGTGSGGIFMSGTTTSAVDLYDVTFQDCDRDVNFSSGCNWLLRLINSPTFSTTNGPGSGKPGMKLCYTFNVLVTNKNNAPLSGALVVLKNNVGATVFSLNTQGDGKLATDQIVIQKSYRNAADGGTVDYNDHSLKITLNGYSDYETDIKIDHKIEADQVCLDALTYTYDDLMTGLTDIKGTGFCYSDDTEILTENGWKLFRELKEDEAVVTLNAEKDELEYQLPTKHFVFNTDKKMCGYEGQSTNFMVTPNHRMWIRKQWNGESPQKWEFKTAKELIGKCFETKKDVKNWKGQEPKYFILPQITYQKWTHNGQRYFDKVEVEKKFLYTDWLKFFGFWLAEGHTNNSGKTHYRVGLSNKDLGLLNEMKKILISFGFNPILTKDDRCSALIVNNKQLWTYLIQFGKALDKYIPKETKTLSKKYLEILFEYMMYGDGWSNGYGYATSSYCLADDVQEILLKMGLAGNILKSIIERNDKKFTAYTVTVLRKRTTPLINRKKTYKEIAYLGKTYCVEVPNGIVYVRRNGRAMWSGNSKDTHSLVDIQPDVAWNKKIIGWLRSLL